MKLTDKNTAAAIAALNKILFVKGDPFSTVRAVQDFLDGSGDVLVEEMGNVLLGYVLFRERQINGGESLELVRVGVSRKWQGGGVGTRLVKRLQRKAGTRPIYTYLSWSNTASYRLLVKAGFKYRRGEFVHVEWKPRRKRKRTRVRRK